jgi:glycosyl transferase family 2
LPETITACLIVQDEEARLPAALDSVAFCDEVVVVDGGSTDRTVEVAREAGAKVIENPWPGYGAQRNVALDHATSDWVLEIDADERILPELQREIRRFLEDPPTRYDMCTLPQFHRFLGAELRPSMKYPFYRGRMFRRGSYRHGETRAVHEGLWPRGPVWPFEHEMSHELAESWQEALRDAWTYARLEASVHPRCVSPAQLVQGMVLRPAAKLGYRLIVDGGWRDGWQGVMRIALDCAHDSLVWMFRALPGPRREPDASSVQGSRHFAQQRPPAYGGVLVVGLASGRRATARVTGWLERAAREGVDVALVTDVPARDGPQPAREGSPPPRDRGFRVRRLPRFGPVSLARALEAERQVRGEPDALVVEGGAARAYLRFVPRFLRGQVPPVDPGEAPDAVKRRLEARREQSPGT